MLRKSLLFIACISLFSSGDLRAMEKVGAEKSTPSSELSLEEKIEKNEELFVQIKKLAEQMDKDAAVNMAIRSWEKLFNLLNDEMKDEVQSFFDQVVAYAKNPHGEEPSLQQLMNEIFSKASIMCSNNSQESFREELCISVISPEARAKFYEIFFKSYNQYISDNTKSVLESINIINLENPSKVLTDSFISMMRGAVNFATQSMAEELSKYYEIDFEALGLEQPKESKTDTTKEISK